MEIIEFSIVSEIRKVPGGGTQKQSNKKRQNLNSEIHWRNNRGAVVCQTGSPNELLFKSYNRLIAVNKKRPATQTREGAGAHNAESRARKNKLQTCSSHFLHTKSKFV